MMTCNIGLTHLECKVKWLKMLEQDVYSENIKLKIGRRSSVYQRFSKRDFYFIKCG
jgi:hypothetical protein